MNINSTLEILALFTILALVGSTLTYIMVLNAFSLEDDEKGPNTSNITTYNDVNNVIKEGLEECSNLDNDACYGVMHTLDNICQISYYPSCFGEKWSKFMIHIEALKEEGHTY
jgi:hypothetical protein